MSQSKKTKIPEPAKIIGSSIIFSFIVVYVFFLSFYTPKIKIILPASVSDKHQAKAIIDSTIRAISPFITSKPSDLEKSTKILETSLKVLGVVASMFTITLVILGYMGFINMKDFHVLRRIAVEAADKVNGLDTKIDTINTKFDNVKDAHIFISNYQKTLKNELNKLRESVKSHTPSILYMEKITEKIPKSISNILYRFQMHYKMNIDINKDYLENNPLNDSEFFALAVASYNNEDYENTIYILHDIIEIKKKNATNLEVFEERNVDIENTRKDLYKLILSKLGSSILWISKDDMNYHKSISYFNAALKIDNNFLPALYNKGVAHSKLKEYHYSLSSFRKAIKSKLNHEESYNNLASTMKRIGDIQTNDIESKVWYRKSIAEYEKSINIFTRNYEKSPYYKFYLNLACVTNNLRELSKDIEYEVRLAKKICRYLDEAIALYPLCQESALTDKDLLSFWEFLKKPELDELIDNIINSKKYFYFKTILENKNNT